ncbi:hypothetical protein [Halalkalibacter sp. APA_J-10(15)]|nr:hypothetical protein [Halalkalibacter sp. APA_J-10(15)]MCK0472669.1 hypothetical protein [Halalkalibacter sp. APA_J-10(15)]
MMFFIIRSSMKRALESISNGLTSYVLDTSGFSHIKLFLCNDAQSAPMDV